MTAIRHCIIKSDPLDCGFRAWFHLYVYETADELNRAAERWSPGFGRTGRALACFQPYLRLKVNAKGRYEHSARSKYLGVMRLTTEQCTPGIVIHECTHAAINYVSALRCRANGYLVSNGQMDKYDEPLCYATQHFSNAVLYLMGYAEELAQV